MIPSNLIQPSSFSLVCFSHIGTCRLQKPYVHVCVCACLEREKGDGGRKTELMRSECLCMYTSLCCVLTSTEWPGMFVHLFEVVCAKKHNTEKSEQNVCSIMIKQNEVNWPIQSLFNKSQMMKMFETLVSKVFDAQ